MIIPLGKMGVNAGKILTMSYTPPPIKRRNVRVDADGSFHYEDGATGCLRRFAFWSILLAVVFIAGFVTLGTTHSTPNANLPWLSGTEHDCAQIIQNFKNALHSLSNVL